MTLILSGFLRWSYIRYADDFVFLAESRAELENLIPTIETFLVQKLRLCLHPQKVFIKTWASGVDFLGWVCFPTRKILRTTTKRRMLKRVAMDLNESVRASYFGMLKHGNTRKLQRQVEVN